MRKRSLIPILSSVFIDMLGYGIVIPIFGPLFLDPNSVFFRQNTNYEIRAIFLGLLIASYSFAQFFGAPILGQYSDKYGRKPLLIISVIGTAVGYILTAISILIGNIYLLFLSRLIDGFTGGNISIAVSSIADISDEKSKAKNFGLIGAVFGLGFILGPVLGGVLSDSNTVPWFSFSTPFIFAGMITIVNAILLHVFFTETLDSRFIGKVNFWSGVSNIQKAFFKINLRILFMVNFLLILGFNFFTQFFQIYLMDQFGFSQSETGYAFAYFGIWVIITQVLILPLIVKIYPKDKIIKNTIFMVSLAFPLLLIPTNPYFLFLILPIIPVLGGLYTPNVIALISNNAKSSEQGEVMGINQSLNALGAVLPPLISGLILAESSAYPILLASVMTISAWAVFTKFYKTGH